MSQTPRPVPPKRLGRPPREVPSVVVHLRLEPAVYDAYARLALVMGEPVNTVIRDVIELHAPTQTARRLSVST